MLALLPTSSANLQLVTFKSKCQHPVAACNVYNAPIRLAPCAASPGGVSGNLNDSSDIKQTEDKQQPQQQQQLLPSSPPPPPPPQQQQQQQQENGQRLPPGYDPQAAAGFLPPPGEKPLWWVEKFEARRLQLAEEQAAAAAAASPSQEAPATSSGGDSGPDGQLQLTAQTAAKAAVQIGQLLLVNAALILWPASLYPGGLATRQIWMLYAVYMLFFAGGSVYRLLRYGQLAARAKDAQGRTWYSTAAWLLFVIAIPIIHWPPIRSFLLLQQQQQYSHHLASAAAATTAASGSPTAVSSVALYDVMGVALLMSAVCLNWWSARALGKAYDRVVKPEKLVTTGPYAFIRHPIYTSYMLLFSGYAMLLHSAPTALFAVAVCIMYYSVRTRLEQAVLREAFGDTYDQYEKGTKMFVPFLW